MSEQLESFGLGARDEELILDDSPALIDPIIIPGEKKMSLISHLEELRKSLIVAGTAVIASTLLCFVYNDVILRWLMKPVHGVSFIFTTPGEAFVASLRAAFLIGLFLAIPIINLACVVAVPFGAWAGWALPFGAAAIFAALVALRAARMTISRWPLRLADVAANISVAAGWTLAKFAPFLGDVPLICAREIPVVGALGMCIRVMVHCYAPPDREIRHIYLHAARQLRTDLPE